MLTRGLLALTTLVACSAASSASDDSPRGDSGEAEDEIKAGNTAIVYFTPGLQDPGLGTRCFAGSSRAAKAILERQEFVGHNDVKGFVVEREGPQGRTL